MEEQRPVRRGSAKKVDLSNETIRKLKDKELKEIEKATNATKKQRYNNNDILAIDDRLQVETIGDVKYRTFIELSNSLQANTILTGVVISTMVYNQIPCAIIMYGDYKVLIPYNEFMNLTNLIPEHMTDKEKETYTKLLLDYRLNSEVDFVVTHLNEEEEIAVASRLKAMKTLMLEKFYFPDRYTGKCIIEKEQKVEARIVDVAPHTLTLEVFGVETVLSHDEISYLADSDLTKTYNVGDRTICIIKDINLGDMTVSIKASIKEASENPRDKFIKSFPVNSKTVGIVTLETGFGYFVRLGGINGVVDALCTAKDIEVAPLQGDKVIVRVSSIDEEQKRIFGSIIKIMNRK